MASPWDYEPDPDDKYCPNCGWELEERLSRLVCDGCGYRENAETELYYEERFGDEVI